MKFRRTSAGIGLALSAALLFGACTSPEAENTSAPTAGGEQTGTATQSAAPTGPRAACRTSASPRPRPGRLPTPAAPAPGTGTTRSRRRPTRPTTRASQPTCSRASSTSAPTAPSVTTPTSAPSRSPRKTR
ncbi:hypothetical protein [Tessaracoccus coleopterorum]|uniref:hypothetical protein n=1 Tax=Tessaracoccus coleopterorum TaxID=2714950 RepID=UPI0018D2EB66|nr:hypothetical protein [Tessaracoccus coleopterorum]